MPDGRLEDSTVREEQGGGRMGSTGFIQRRRFVLITSLILTWRRRNSKAGGMGNFVVVFPWSRENKADFAGKPSRPNDGQFLPALRQGRLQAPDEAGPIVTGIHHLVLPVAD